MTDVPCNGCTACCHGPIMLHPSLGDDPTRYATVQDAAWGIRLAQKDDGSCAYLKDGGCGIHDRRPAICRAFDCRVYTKGWGKLDPLRDEAVIAAGAALLKMAARCGCGKELRYCVSYEGGCVASKG